MQGGEDGDHHGADGMDETFGGGAYDELAPCIFQFEDPAAKSDDGDGRQVYEGEEPGSALGEEVHADALGKSKGAGGGGPEDKEDIGHQHGQQVETEEERTDAAPQFSTKEGVNKSEHPEGGEDA